MPTVRSGSKTHGATIVGVNERPQTIDDADLAAVGALLAEPARAKVLLALADGRSLAASVLASEAGVAASTASHHLAKLVDAGQITAVTRCIGTSRSRGPRNFSAIKPAPGL
jgi:DNA-binding transcriptional ArsR family regulator